MKQKILRYAGAVGVILLLLLGVAWGMRHSASSGPPSPTNPVYSHSLDLRDLGAPSDALVGSFSISPDGKRMGIITTTPDGNPSQMLLCDLDGQNAVIAPTGNWEHRAPLWCSNHRIVTGTSRCTHTGKPAVTESFSFRDEATGKIVTGTRRSTNPEKNETIYSLTVWDARSGKIVSELRTEGIYFAGAVNPTNRSEVVLLPHHSGFDQKDFPVSLRKWNIDTDALTVLPQTGLSYHGVTWLADGDILAYGCIYPTKLVTGPNNSMLFHGDTVIVRLNTNGNEVRRTAQPIYLEISGGYKNRKSLLTTIQPSQPAIAGRTIWPITSSPVGALLDIASMHIVDSQSRFKDFGISAIMATGHAVVSNDDQFIYFSKEPDLWIYDPKHERVIKHWRTGTGDGLAVTPDGQFLLTGNNRRIDFYRLKP